MIKIGELYLGDGVWQGKQILPPGWVEQTLIARGSEGQLIAIVPDRHPAVAVGSVPTKDCAIASSDVSFLLTEVILPALS